MADMKQSYKSMTVCFVDVVIGIVGETILRVIVFRTRAEEGVGK